MRKSQHTALPNPDFKVPGYPIESSYVWWLTKIAETFNPEDFTSIELMEEFGDFARGSRDKEWLGDPREYISKKKIHAIVAGLIGNGYVEEHSAKRYRITDAGLFLIEKG